MADRDRFRTEPIPAEIVRNPTLNEKRQYRYVGCRSLGLPTVKNLKSRPTRSAIIVLETGMLKVKPSTIDFTRQGLRSNLFPYLKHAASSTFD